MAETWFISDTHFGHTNIIEFLDNENNRIRPFMDIEDHDETLVKNWNERVRPQDRIYHLGDVVMNKRCLPILSRLNGRKVLIKGNHDIFPLKDYTPYFEDIRAYKVFPKHGLICSHIPVHPRELEKRFTLNVHGHLHHNMIITSMVEHMRDGPSDVSDKRYKNICVEFTNYAPVALGEILK